METRFVRWRLTTAVVATASALLGGAGPAAAQLIPIKTVPVAAGDQFLIFPSDRLGMGSVSIALQDTLGDPFGNPATLRRLDEGRVFGSPTAYSITGGNGGAVTLPVGGLFTGSAWRGGVGLALQELDRGDGPADFWWWNPIPEPTELSQKSRTNLYGFGAVSRTLGESGQTSIGASVSLADLSALQGVDMLYARRTVRQSGSMVDVRLGLESAWGDGQAVEAVLVRSRLDMEHGLRDVIWEPVEQEGVPPEQWPWEPRVVDRTEFDETDTWGLHVEYSRPLEGEGWRVGGILTANIKSHPKIPNYTLMSIPRDPGDSWAYDLGFGVSKRTDRSVFGIDLIYEPIRTQTWADAPDDVVAVGGDTIPAGDMTVYNDFKFDNAIVRMGVAGHTERIDLQIGLQLRRYAYTLAQTDFVMERNRRQREDWMEWTPTLGLTFRFDDFSIRYGGRITTGTGRPGTANDRFPAVADAAVALAADFLPAPSGALTLQDETVHTHQVSVAIPFGER